MTSYIYSNNAGIQPTLSWNGYAMRFELDKVGEGALFNEDLLELAFKSINLHEVKIWGIFEYEDEAMVATAPAVLPKPVRWLATRAIVNDKPLTHRQLERLCKDLVLSTVTIQVEEEVDKLVDTAMVERILKGMESPTIGDMRYIINTVFHDLSSRDDVDWSYQMQRVVGKRVAGIARALLVGGD